MDGQGKAKVALTFALYQGEQLIRRDTIAQDIVKVGKDPRSHLRVDDELASRMHAVIEVAAPSDITLIDLGNEPGTLVNGQRVNKCKIRPGDQVQIGSTLIVLEQAEIAQAAAPTPPVPAVAPFAPPAVASAPAVPPSAPASQPRPMTPPAAYAPPNLPAKPAMAPPAPPSPAAANPFGAANPFAAAANPFAAGAPVAASANPFAQANPFVAPARDAAPMPTGLGLGLEAPLDPTAAQNAGAYSMLKSGPDVNPDEVEVAHLSAVEVLVMWDTNVLHVSHLTPPRSFYVGEEFQGDVGCDYFIPSETLGTTRAPVVVARGGAAALVMLPRSHGTVDIPGQGKLTFADLIASGRARPSSELSGAHEFDLPPGAKARMELENSSLAFQVSAVHAGKAALMSSPLDLVVLLYYGFSLLLHVGVLATFFFWYDRLDMKDFRPDDDVNASALNPALNALAEHEQEEEKPKEDQADQKDKEGGTGERHKGEEGSMGNPNVTATNKRYAVKGPSDNKDPHLAKERALEEAKNYGAIGLINTLNIGGDPNAPTSAFSNRDDTLGNDEVSARGNMFGKEIGDAFGNGGLGLTGTGEGGGGSGFGVGLGGFGGLGHGAGRGKGQGIGGGSGVGGGNHVASAPKVRAGAASVSGRLPPEVIQRVVRQNFGRFTQCYLRGLANNPSLTGRVAVMFVIDRGGAVSLASNAGSDLPDGGVVGCVVGGFRSLSFPAPDNGTVTVTYPIFFQPE